MEQIRVITNLRPSLLQSIIFVFVGVALSIWSNHILSFIVEFMGFSVIFLSVISLINYYRIKKSFPEIKRIPPIDSYVSMLFGILLVLFPAFFLSILMVIIGLVALTGGIVQLYSFSQLKKMGILIRSYAYISPIILVMLGVLIVVNPFGFANVLLILLFGVTSIIYGATNIVKYFICK